MSSVKGLTNEQYENIVPRAECIAPRPKTVAETGLSLTFLADLLENCVRFARAALFHEPAGAFGRRQESEHE